MIGILSDEVDEGIKLIVREMDTGRTVPVLQDFGEAALEDLGDPDLFAFALQRQLHQVDCLMAHDELGQVAYLREVLQGRRLAVAVPQEGLEALDDCAALDPPLVVLLVLLVLLAEVRIALQL